MERLDGVAVGEPTFPDQPQRELGRPERIERRRVRPVGLGEQPHHVGVRLEEAAPRPGAGLASRGPVAPILGGELEPAHDVVADPAQQVVLVLDVVVERHRLDADLAGHAAHRDRVEPLGVHHVQGRVDHAFAAQSFPGLRGSHGSPNVQRIDVWIRVDILTLYAYPPYTVSIHRTSMRSGRFDRSGGRRDEDQSRNVGTGEQPPRLADRRRLGGHPDPRLRSVRRPAERSAHDGIRLHEQPGGDPGEDAAPREAARAGRDPGDVRDDRSAGGHHGSGVHGEGERSPEGCPRARPERRPEGPVTVSRSRRRTRPIRRSRRSVRSRPRTARRCCST